MTAWGPSLICALRRSGDLTGVNTHPDESDISTTMVKERRERNILIGPLRMEPCPKPHNELANRRAAVWCVRVERLVGQQLFENSNTQSRLSNKVGTYVGLPALKVR